MVVDSPESGFLRTLIGGVLGGFIGASMSLSLAGLVFSGAASSGLGLGITGSLLGGAVVAIVSAMKSSHPGVVAGTQDSTAAIIAVAASAAVIQSERAVATTFAMVIVATGAMGVAFWLAGRFHLGRLLHYVPYPVILGFIGATGTVILVGSLAVLGWEVPADTSVALPELIPGALLGVALFAGLRWLTFKYFVPVAMVVTGVAIHWWAAATGDERFSTFLGPFADTAGFRPTAVLQLADADWAAVFGQSAILITVVFVGVVSFMLNAYATSEALGYQPDVDHDMPSLGLANVAAAAVGGLPAFLLLSDSTAVAKVSGAQRGTGVIAGLFYVAVMVGGTRLFSIVPTAVVGGVLIFIALNFFDDAFWSTRSNVRRSELALILAMTVAPLVVSFGLTIALGLVGAVALFVVRYARIDVVQRTTDVVDYPDLIDRTKAEQEALELHRGEAVVLTLRGFLFFATSRQAGEVLAALPAQTVILDVRRVTGVDSSAKRELERSASYPDRTVIVVGSQSVWPEADFADVAEAVTEVRESFLDDWSRPDMGIREHSFAASFELREYSPGEVLITEGQQQPGLFLIEGGSCSIMLETESVSKVIRRLRSGDLIGEVSLYDERPTASATVVVAEPSTIWHLGSDGVRDLEQNHPTQAAELHRYVASVLAGRVRSTDETVRALRLDIESD